MATVPLYLSFICDRFGHENCPGVERVPMREPHSTELAYYDVCACECHSNGKTAVLARVPLRPN